MQIVIHRGTHQIGGCATELRTARTRILIDFGAPLPDNQGTENSEPLVIPGLNQGAPGFDAVFLTHYHGDHVGLIDQIPPSIPLYMGRAAIEIYQTYARRVGSGTLSAAKRIRPLAPFETVCVGDMKLTALPADHSAFDAFMYLAEGEGRRVLHTGDFRLHGPRGGSSLAMLKGYADAVDCLITEGTRLSHPGAGLSEAEVAEQIKSAVGQWKYVFALCSSTNIDRLNDLSRATPRGRYFLCDDYQKEILDRVNEASERADGPRPFQKVTVYGPNLDHKLDRRGFVMLARGNPRFAAIAEKFPDAFLIYSMWQGYLDGRCPALSDFVRPFQERGRFLPLHASGHADTQSIRALCQTVRPCVVIPIHTDAPERLQEVASPYPVIPLTDGAGFDL